ncbi:MAG: hypothetical protein BWX96_01955 [Bacteroidetes bacterium ADurb.Bin145]|nr:MAG: hypothetical protein BWX96_01955 [Bacteroidetes bacterium ADurb.Bin145]
MLNEWSIFRTKKSINVNIQNLLTAYPVKSALID